MRPSGAYVAVAQWGWASEPVGEGMGLSLGEAVGGVGVADGVVGRSVGAGLSEADGSAEGDPVGVVLGLGGGALRGVVAARVEWSSAGLAVAAPRVGAAAGASELRGDDGRCRPPPEPDGWEDVTLWDAGRLAAPGEAGGAEPSADEGASASPAAVSAAAASAAPASRCRPGTRRDA